MHARGRAHTHTYTHTHSLTQSKVDITGWGTYLMVPAAVLLALVFIGVFWVNRIVYLVIAGERCVMHT